MVRNRKLLIVLLALLVFFTCASLVLHFDILSLLFPSGETASGGEVAVSMIPLDKIAAAEWMDGDVLSFSVEKDGQNEWFSPEYAGEALDQDKVTSAVTALCQVVSGREIEDPNDLAAYGLSPAQRCVTLRFTDGGSVTYLLGALNSYTNRYYFQMEQETIVHTVGYSVGQAMSCGIEDFITVSDSASKS